MPRQPTRAAAPARGARAVQQEHAALMERAERLPGVAETLDLYRRAAATGAMSGELRTSSVSDRTNT
jgi:hypothetical protein